MKSILTSLLCMFAIVKIASAQFPSSAYYVFMGDNNGKSIKFGKQSKQAEVKSYEITFLNEKGKTQRKQAYQLNNAGNIIYQVQFKKNGTMKRSSYSSYLNDTLLTNRVTLNKMGDTLSKSIYTFEQGKMISSVVSYGKKTTAYLYTYDKIGNRTSYNYKRNGLTKLTIKYEYDEAGKLIKQSTYNKQNKLIAVVNYECNYQGQVEKRVDQSKICIRKDALPNGGYVVYNDYTKPNGKLIRNVSTYNSDSNLVQVQSYDHKNKLISTSKYQYDHDGNCTQHDYTIKNVNFISTYRYNSKKLLEEYTNKKHQQVYNLVKYTYVYR